MNIVCRRCGRSLDEKQFYTYKDGSKTEMCKKCLTAHVDNFDPDTFLWLLEKLDVPYIPEEWDALRNKAFDNNPNNMNGTSVFGKYLSKMRLIQYKKLTWADTERLQKEKEAERALAKQKQEEIEAEVKERYANGEITEAEYKTLMSPPTQNTDMMYGHGPIVKGPNNYYNEDKFMSEEELVDPAAELTQEDKICMAMKWGRLYTPSQWITLEKKYEEMMNSFDIQDSDTEGTLILICKTYLKMNEAIDSGDTDGYQKLSRVYDTLRKSAKFTAAQNKDSNGEFVDSVGELVSLCEKEGFIERYCTDIPQDKVDITLKDMNNYVYKLVTQDLGFGRQIEDALKKIQIQKEMEEDEDSDLDLEDEDMVEYYEDVENQKQQDVQTMKEAEEE